MKYYFAPSFRLLEKYLYEDVVCEDIDGWTQIRGHYDDKILYVDNDLFDHDGHDVRCVSFGEDGGELDQCVSEDREAHVVAIGFVCEDCGEVLYTIDRDGH